MFNATKDQVNDPLKGHSSWKRGAVAGCFATIVMGGFIMAMDLELLQTAIAGLYAQEGNLAAGWAAHLLHGTIFGLLFAAIVSEPTIAGATRHPWKIVAVSTVYGLILSVAAAGIIMPIWLQAVGLSEIVSLPHVTRPMVLWHLVYGACLGAVFAAFDGQ